MTTETMTASTPGARSEATPTTGFGATLASEWRKLTSLRFTYITLGLGFGLSIATTALASLALGSTQDELPADLDPITFSMVGNVFALIVFSVFGVIAMAGEYSSGMIRLTFTATPRRERVFFAKLVLVAAITLVAGLASTVGMFLVAQAILGSYGLPVTDLGDPDARRAILGLGAVTPFFPVVGLALGALLRSTAGAITTVLGLLWLPIIFGEVLPMWWRENVISALPGTALDSLTIGHIVDSPTFSEPVEATLIAAVWFVGFMAAGCLALMRRDV